MRWSSLYKEICIELHRAGMVSSYTSDADEKDPLYKAYGIRSIPLKAIIKDFSSKIKLLSLDDKLKFIDQLVQSGYGEQQSIAFFIMEQIVDYYTPERFPLLEEYIHHFHGWSKIDGFSNALLQPIFNTYPKELLPILEKWNRSESSWERRASVVVLTKKIGESGKYTTKALALCTNLLHDKEDLVLKAVGWCLKDNLRGNKAKVMEYIEEIKKQGVSSIITSYALRDIRKEITILHKKK